MQPTIPWFQLHEEDDVTAVNRIDPITDPRWPEFLQSHPRASIFHTRGWLEALRRTYGYQPMAFTTTASAQELADGLLFCCINSRFTGRRLVSLPFSDHCEPLTNTREDLTIFLRFLEQNLKKEKWRYVELRPLNSLGNSLAGFEQNQTSFIHVLDLARTQDEIFRSFHKDSIQRKIRRAEREGLSYDEGRSEQFLDQFYQLLLRTRRRHQLPPQPRQWFRNLIDCLGDQLKIRVASKDGQPMASILTLEFKRVMVYKYGCSDAQYHNLGPMHLLFWKTIQEAKNKGLNEFDLGRSDADNAGLVEFKDRWGATRSTLDYLRYPPAAVKLDSHEGWGVRVAKQLFHHLPDGFLEAAGKLLYRHVG
jgi:CelD/BcsL family acetyltransferase involved in cellulose biosynthesis